MPAINADNASAWQQLAKDLSAQRPSVGKTVTVNRGKHKGRTGVVKRHMLDRYSTAYRYSDGASAHFKDIAGRAGWCVLVESPAGDFWTKADNVTVESV